jgi:hypothetical protein
MVELTAASTRRGLAIRGADWRVTRKGRAAVVDSALAVAVRLENTPARTAPGAELGAGAGMLVPLLMRMFCQSRTLIAPLPSVS